MDDSLHPSLSRARALDQVTFDNLTSAGRDAYGQAKVQEVEAKSALQRFAFQDASAWSLNPYMGCAHQCTYCYVPDTIKAERSRWGRYVILKRNVATLLAREVHQKPAATTYLSTGTDPYQPVEAEHRMTRACLQILARAGWPVDVLTRSPLVLRDLDHLDRPGVRVGLSVPTMDDVARRAIEPHAPPVDARLDTLRRLVKAGISTYANVAPIYPLTNRYTHEDTAQTLAEVGVQWVNISPWRRRTSILPIVAAKLGLDPQGVVPRIRRDEEQINAHQTLRDALLDVGLHVTDGFFTPPGPQPARWPASLARPAVLADGARFLHAPSGGPQTPSSAQALPPC